MDEPERTVSTVQELLDFWSQATKDAKVDENREWARDLLLKNGEASFVRFSKQHNFVTFKVNEDYATFLIRSGQMIDGELEWGDLSFIEAAVRADAIERMSVELPASNDSDIPLRADIDWQTFDPSSVTWDERIAFDKALERVRSTASVVADRLVSSTQSDLAEATKNGTRFPNTETLQRYFMDPERQLSANGSFALSVASDRVLMEPFSPDAPHVGAHLIVDSVEEANDLSARLSVEIKDVAGAAFPWESATDDVYRTWRSDRGEPFYSAVVRVRAGFDEAYRDRRTPAMREHASFGYLIDRPRLPEGFKYASDLSVDDIVGDRSRPGSTPDGPNYQAEESLPTVVTAVSVDDRYVNVTTEQGTQQYGYNDVVEQLPIDFGKVFDDNGVEVSQQVRPEAVAPGDVVAFSLPASYLSNINERPFQQLGNPRSELCVRAVVDMRHTSPRVLRLCDLSVQRSDGTTITGVPSYLGRYVELSAPRIVERFSNLHRSDLTPKTDLSKNVRDADMVVLGGKAYSVFGKTESDGRINLKLADVLDGYVIPMSMTPSSPILRIPASEVSSGMQTHLDQYRSKSSVPRHFLDGFPTDPSEVTTSRSDLGLSRGLTLRTSSSRGMPDLL